MRVGLDDMLEGNTKVDQTQDGLEPSSSQSIGLLSVASVQLYSCMKQETARRSSHLSTNAEKTHVSFIKWHTEASTRSSQ
jgi:hypothetical protein